MIFNLELTTWLWLAYLVPVVILGAVSVVAVLDDGCLTLGELVAMSAKTLIPVFNILHIIWLLLMLLDSFEHEVIWRRKQR